MNPPNLPAEAGDDVLFLAMQQGNADAFWALWQIHAPRLFALCLQEMRGHRAEAEDALQQAMLKARLKLPLCVERVHCPGAWLATLTRNVCRDTHRARARSVRAASQWTAPMNAGTEEDQSEDEVDAVLLAGILPARLRVVFVLRVLKQMPYKDIAGQLEITCEAARKRSQEARAALQRWRDRGELPVQRRAAGCVATARPISHLSRVHQKIRTLRAYIGRHPRGWKMRLRLADLLFGSGSWPEAAEWYRDVLKVRPWLAAAHANLARIARLTGNSKNSQSAPGASSQTVVGGSPGRIVDRCTTR